MYEAISGARGCPLVTWVRTLADGVGHPLEAAVDRPPSLAWSLPRRNEQNGPAGGEVDLTRVSGFLND